MTGNNLFSLTTIHIESGVSIFYQFYQSVLLYLADLTLISA